MDTKQLIAETRRLWLIASNEEHVDSETLTGLEPEIVIGAQYAELAERGVVTLNESGVEKVEAAYEVLSELVSAVETDDEDEEDE
jgi:hypothetical protein